MKVETTPFATIEAALEDIREGKFVVVVDAADEVSRRLGYGTS